MKQTFSLRTYLITVFIFSWPFQIAGAIAARSFTQRYICMSLSMIMVTVGTLVYARLILRDNLSELGWTWGRIRHHAYVLLLILVLWVAPLGLGLAMGAVSLSKDTSLSDLLPWAGYALLTMIPAFGEEFGWRGYMLKNMAEQYPNKRRAIFIHGVIWWLWHAPVIVAPAMDTYGTKGLSAVILTGFVLLVASAGLSIFHGILFAYIRVASGSLAVVTLYHGLYDGARDSILYNSNLQTSPFIYWPTSLLLLLGILAYFRTDWE